MNRRNFLVRLGAAAVGATALALDPERLLWVPGAKTIVDFGATKQVVPATDREMVETATARIFRGRQPGGGKARSQMLDVMRERDIVLTIGSEQGNGVFRYKGEQLVSLHSEKELALLDRPLFAPSRRW